MSQVKRYYHDELMLQQTDVPLDQQDHQMSEAEIEDYLDALYADYLAKQEAYYYEDNYKPFELEKARSIKNTET